MLCVYNLSKVAQPVELELGQLNGKRPVELFGRVPFPLIGELPYFVTLPSYGFYWFSLVDQLGDDLRWPADRGIGRSVAATVTAVETGIQTCHWHQINAPA